MAKKISSWYEISDPVIPNESKGISKPEKIAKANNGNVNTSVSILIKLFTWNRFQFAF